MRFSAKCVLADFVKADRSQAVELRAIIDRRQACIPLGFSIQAELFDKEQGYAKKTAPNADLMNYHILEALTKANKIFLEYKFSARYLTPALFRREFIDPLTSVCFNDFFERELELRKPKLDPATYGAQKASLDKLRKYQKRLLFPELTVEWCQRFENFLVDLKLNLNTIHKVFRHIKVYIHEAERKKIQFDNPFEKYKVKKVSPRKPTLMFEEVQKLFRYFYSYDVPAAQKNVLRYFLFSCVTGIRISDVARLTWDDLRGETLSFLPHKTRKEVKYITIPLPKPAMDLLEFVPGRKELFDCYAAPTTNLVLKDIAKACDIKLTLTYHVSRHTFGTEFLDRGGQLDTLQQLMGHSQITTTMQYTTVSSKRKKKEITKAFKQLREEPVQPKTRNDVDPQGSKVSKPKNKPIGVDRESRRP